MTRAIVVTLAALVVAGCSATSAGGNPAGGAAGSGGGPGPKVQAAQSLREVISTGLRKSGRSFEADTVARGESKLTLVRTPFLKSWRIIRVDYLQGPHPVLLHVAAGRSAVHLLTGDPSAFNKATAAAGAAVADPRTAAELAGVYLATTRPAGRLTYVVKNVNEIRWRPNLRGADAQRREQIVRRYGRVVKPPTARPAGGQFSVVAYVVQNQELQRRTLTITANGAVRERSEVLVPDLPTPFVI